MRNVARSLFGAVVLACVGAAGCASNGPPVTPVEGVIKINGAPASNLLIQVTPVVWEGSGKVLSATGVSDKSGRFVLKCDNGQTGAPVGKHKVLVIDNNLAVEDEPKPGVKPPQNRVPSGFAAASSTPLEMLVEAGKKEYEVNVVFGR